MKTIGTFLLVLIVLFFTGKLCCGQNLAEQDYFKGVKYGAEGKFEPAKRQFENARKIDQFCETVKALLKITEDAMDQKIKPMTAIHLFKGICHSEKRQWDDAIAEFNTAIKSNSAHAYTYTFRGFPICQRAIMTRRSLISTKR